MKQEIGRDEEARRPPSFTINLEESWEAAWWAAHFGVSRAELLAAILKVGVDAEAVRQVLGK